MLMKCWMVPARKLCCTQSCTRKLPQINGIFRRECKTLIFLNDCLFFMFFFSAGFGKDSDKMTVLVFVLSPSF